MADMVITQVIPSGMRYQTDLISNLKGLHDLGIKKKALTAQTELLEEVTELINTLKAEADSMLLAIEKANNTAYGLSAGVWTDKGSRILKMSTELKAGVVWANTYNKFDPTSPFGGYKESGFGREGGRQGLMDYCKVD